MIKFIDLFCGIGAFHQALSIYNAKCVFACDFNREAQKTYFLNYNIMPEGDIEMVDEYSIPSYDILCAGFPCHPFSQGGQKKAFEDPRSNSFFSLIKFVDVQKPKVIVLENVKHLISINGGNAFKVIKDKLTEQGYNVFHKIIDSKNWVPQSRNRLYIIALNKNHFNDVVFEFPNPPEKPLYTLNQIIKPNNDQSLLLKNGTWSYLLKHKNDMHEQGYGYGYTVIDENTQHTRTITARYAKDGSECLIAQKYKNPRRLSPREGLDLMGFPKSFTFPASVSYTNKFKLIGNSIVVPVLTDIMKPVIKLLQESQ
jgi:DNA (cytosine-5)-methyltransferase 1